MKFEGFTVMRSRWLRGQGFGLLKVGRHDSHAESIGKMCCLGFACLSLGLTEWEITDVTRPDQLPSSRRGIVPQELQEKIGAIVLSNDVRLGQTEYDNQQQLTVGPFSTEEERELELVRLFAARGISIRFMD